MTNRQASKLRAGERVRPKDGEGAVYAVERIERVPSRTGNDVLVHAGGHVFWSWEVERCAPPQGWPAGGAGQ